MKRSLESMDVDTTVTKRARTRAPRTTTGRKLSTREKREVKKLIAVRQELKFFGTIITTTAVTSTAAIGKFSAVPQGDGDSTRDGDRLMWCGTMEWNLIIINGLGATGDAYTNVRLLIFQWHPADGTAPTAPNILLNGPSGTPDIMSVYNHDTRQLYKIIHDKVYTQVGSSSSASFPLTSVVTTGVVRLRIPTTNIQKQAQYNAAGVTGTNQLYYLLVSDSILATHPTIAAAVKVFFRDS